MLHRLSKTLKHFLLICLKRCFDIIFSPLERGKGVCKKAPKLIIRLKMWMFITHPYPSLEGIYLGNDISVNTKLSS